ncbi:MAG: class I SAM-dependent methyltransferase [Anaerolineae bacterium]
MAEYETIRRAEGRGSDDSRYYRALPFADRSGRFSADWQIRAQSFRVLLDKVVTRLEQERRRPLRILDLGAGNGWLSYRLALRGHSAAAVDLQVNEFDGLGAHGHYDAPFTPVQASFDRLPFAPRQADLVIFNASLHYATRFEPVLKEAMEVISAGALAVVDTPVYHDAASGAQMVREREARFRATHGFPSNALESENYLTYGRLQALEQSLCLSWKLFWPVWRGRRAVRRWRARLRGHRQPAQFPVVVGWL